MGMSLYNLEPFKNLTADNYNLMSIGHSEDQPYFFGMGMASKFNCNYGFKNKNQMLTNNYDGGDSK